MRTLFPVVQLSLFLFAVLFLPTVLLAIDPPALVKDINTETQGGQPYGMVDIGGTVFFVQESRAVMSASVTVMPLWLRNKFSNRIFSE